MTDFIIMLKEFNWIEQICMCVCCLGGYQFAYIHYVYIRVDSRFGHSQWKTCYSWLCPIHWSHGAPYIRGLRVQWIRSSQFTIEKCLHWQVLTPSHQQVLMVSMVTTPAISFRPHYESRCTIFNYNNDRATLIVPQGYIMMNKVILAITK